MGETIAIVGGTLIDGNGGVPVPETTVFIEDGRITKVGSTDQIEVHPNIRQIDAQGKWILPGLVNGNVHLLDGIMMMGRGGIEYLARFEGNYYKVIEEAAQIALRGGVTTVFDTWNALEPVTIARDRIASGAAEGARIFFAGTLIGMGGPFTGDFMRPSMQARTVMSRTFADRMDAMFEVGMGRHLSTLPPAEVRPLIREYLERGVDFCKIAVTDHLVGLLGFRAPYFTFSERVLDVLVDEVRRAGVPLLTHTTSLEGLNTAIERDADLMIHATMTGQAPIPEETIEKLLEKQLWSEVQPTTIAQQAWMDSVDHPFADFSGRVHHENDVRMIKAGVPLVLGTDAGCTDPDILEDMSQGELHERPWTLGEDHFVWMQAMVEKGMDPMAAILAGTANPAKAYRKFDELGSIDVGKLGDVVVLDQDPLADITNMRTLSHVVKEGREIDFHGLPLSPLVTAYPRTANVLD
ncbi:amidohydrolase family protein [Gulosibacter molinativorax]|uniref:Molinate hydrolase n=1 Tax=Gulosibacter molinativorax TaxID=256821 RepID=G2XLB0_9MICO|nr:amidohydrolase family protein [Gulosibacter molinativorax]4WGX_A Chain A, Molinate hydrolase [Gulosibacter molinativorax]4WGX_B Chain B, Molinate hydrolase [Gulosibacter molinativorax]4WGX_C Chain C, Molinate hydrolase [Gulosibacter molinativorax]4WGX_D Chain D, Molinate hydrolase [Gulosibacter molinativorax]QUY63953.1 Molinate hydrolase [Gulosibacter molinativorax]QUY63956.1 Molinate hydrolase [Gulosibacter molinativorax]QUY63959.1 Molinate hydrolase [Gulosibacter molinativorax]CBN73087